jgi:hypothetical protein
MAIERYQKRGDPWITVIAWVWLASGARSVVAAPCVDPDGDHYVQCSNLCVLQSGQSCGDCAEFDATIHPGASDATCNGINEDCDTNNGPPPVLLVSGLRALGNNTDFTWDPVAGAVAYDVVQGNLLTVRSAGGVFVPSLTSCGEEHSSDVTTSLASSPVPGGAFYYIVRYRDSCENFGTYDEGSPYQVGSRDEIRWDPLSCWDPGDCLGENPSDLHCASDADCFPGLCRFTGCTPTACYCTGQWRCTNDCLGHCTIGP